MIIARICLPGGKMLFHGSVEIEGSPAGDDYRQGGWFPVDQFSFGDFPEEGKNDQPKPGTPPAKGAPARPTANVPAGAKAPAGSRKKRSEMTISKEVDRATTDLMVLFMEERSRQQGTERGASGGKELHADVHVLGSVVFGTKVERNIFPSLMIHLECIGVTRWSINGSGDNRPSESVTLEFDRAAMHYSWFDGSTFLHFGPKGWDQHKQKPWEGAEALPAFKKYIPST